LIGEHIDYALFGVFPAAIERDILMAIGPSSRVDNSVNLGNTDEKYPGQTLIAKKSSTGEWVLPINKNKLSWESYVKAGYLGVLNHFFQKDEVPQSCNILVHGIIPAGSGLSSSAAMVVASSISFLLMNSKLEEMNKGSLVELAMENERRVGVNSGGYAIL
jgi:galactokinase